MHADRVWDKTPPVCHEATNHTGAPGSPCHLDKGPLHNIVHNSIGSIHRVEVKQATRNGV